MGEEFLGDRIAALRIAKGVSAREMSLSIGQSPNYINKIENKKSLPSIPAFLYICEYLNVTPQEFFDTGSKHPERLKELIADLKKLDNESLSNITTLVKGLISNK